MDDNEISFTQLRRHQKREVPWWVAWAKVLDPLMFVLLVALLTLIYSPAALLPPYLPNVGDVAIHDVKATRDILIEDPESTQQRRELASAAVLPVYDWDGDMLSRLAVRLAGAVLWVEQARTTALADEQNAQISQGVAERLERKLPPKVLESLIGYQDLSGLADRLSRWLEGLASLRVVASQDQVRDLERTTYLLRAIHHNFEQRVMGAVNLSHLDEFRRRLNERGEELLANVPRNLRQWLISYAVDQSRPNLGINMAETTARRQVAYDAVEPVYFQARQGEMILREGTVVTEAARLKIEALNRAHWTGMAVLRILGLAGVLALCLWQGRRFLLQTASIFPRDRKTLYLQGAILLIVALLSAVIFTVGQGLAELFSWPAQAVAYMAPVALGSALTSLIVGARLSLPGGSIILGAVLSFLVSLMANGGLGLFIFYLIGSLVGGYTLRRCRHRFDVLKAGAWIGVFQMASVPVVEALSGHLPSLTWLLAAAMGLTGGLLAGVVGLGIIPLLETVFNITTDSRLLELASGDHPLLRELSIRAPGTYHHSVMMGNLAEAGAKAIGANPLLARVMALYHDIGKMVKPQYFVENQSGENRHDHLTPSLSVKVIQSHIKDGLELAREYKLGDPILEAISEHQGTSLLQFFYNKALNEAAKRPGGDAVVEAEFRYPGPRPQSPESGILMMADAVEAAARTLRNPSPAQIQALVRRLTRAKIEDGQLDECKLTLRQLAQVEEAFVRVLTLGFYHRRIEYPEQVRRQRENTRHAPHPQGLDQPNPSAVAPR